MIIGGMCMTGKVPHPCYLCGKPCWNKGCAECLRRGKHSGLAKYNNRKRKEKRSNGVAFVSSESL
jgi:hypothetical protein